MFTIYPLDKVNALINIAPDKSISHRALILSAICRGRTVIKPFLESDDTQATIRCLQSLGAGVRKRTDGSLLVEGHGLFFPGSAPRALYAGESGATMRILSGVLCGQKFPVEFSGAPSLERRPMGRIIEPLRKMGADINGRQYNGQLYPPILVKPVKRLKKGTFPLKVASAQVKSALLLAGLYVSGAVKVSEPYISRDHTERMLKLFGARISVRGSSATIRPVKALRSPGKVAVPGDFSSAAFFIVMAAILKDSSITIKKVNLNPSRCGLLQVLKRMAADIRIGNQRKAYEPYADITVKSSRLKGILVQAREIPSLIDEIPILCVAAAFAGGRTEIRGVGELRVKETDRLASMISNLRGAGVDISDKPYGKKDYKLVINGKPGYAGGIFSSHGDHRTAMSMIIFALACARPSRIDDIRCINKSFPGFVYEVSKLYADCQVSS